MIKNSQATMWVVIAGALITAGAAVTATQLVASQGSSGSASAVEKESPKGSKSPTAEPPPKGLVLGGSLSITGLVPGASVSRTLTIGNENNQDVELQSVKTLITGPSPAPTVGSCSSPADFEVIVAGYNASTGAGAPVTLKKNSSLSVPVTIRLNDSATRNQNACKARSWTFTFTATANSK